MLESSARSRRLSIVDFVKLKKAREYRAIPGRVASLSRTVDSLLASHRDVVQKANLFLRQIQKAYPPIMVCAKRE